MRTLKRTIFVESMLRFLLETKKCNMKAAKRLSPSRILIQTAVPKIINDFTPFNYIASSSTLLLRNLLKAY